MGSRSPPTPKGRGSSVLGELHQEKQCLAQEEKELKGQGMCQQGIPTGNGFQFIRTQAQSLNRPGSG